MRIDFELARAGEAEFRVRDVAGRTVATIPAGRRDAGIASFSLDAAGKHVAPGVYFLSLVVDGVEADRTRIILLR
ncbi:MAG: FlgD immunoglobulin-like domain containing protein [Candidatus Eiseniibacteriota bacterium]